MTCVNCGSEFVFHEGFVGPKRRTCCSCGHSWVESAEKNKACGMVIMNG